MSFLTELSVFLKSLRSLFLAGVDVCVGVGLKLQSGVESRVLNELLVAKELRS